MNIDWNWRVTDLLSITEMQIIPFTFLIFDYIFVCGVLSGVTLLSYVVLQYCTGQDNIILTNSLTIHHKAKMIAEI